MVAWNLGSLLFALIDTAIPDELDNGIYDYALFSRDFQIRSAIAGLVVGGPIFAWLAFHIRKQRRTNPAMQRSRVRKWLTYATLILASCTLIGDAIGLVYNFLAGELSIRLILKLIVIAILAGGVFFYFIRDAEEETPMTSKHNLGPVIALTGAGIAVAAVIAGFILVGGPGDARERRLDDMTMQRISSVTQTAQCVFNVTGAAPVSIEEMHTVAMRAAASGKTDACGYGAPQLASDSKVQTGGPHRRPATSRSKSWITAASASAEISVARLTRPTHQASGATGHTLNCSRRAPLRASIATRSPSSNSTTPFPHQSCLRPYRHRSDLLHPVRSPIYPSMQTFAALLERLVLTPSRNAKLQLICDYLRHTRDPARGWALAAITGDLDIPSVKPAAIRELVASRVDPILFNLSYDYVGDLAETISLIWPQRPGANRAPDLNEIVETLLESTKAQGLQLVEGWLDALDSTGRWGLLKLITGGLRVGVSARLARQAAADFGKVDVAEIEELWHGMSPPYLGLLPGSMVARQSLSPARSPCSAPPMLAHPAIESAAAGSERSRPIPDIASRFRC